MKFLFSIIVILSGFVLITGIRISNLEDEVRLHKQKTKDVMVIFTKGLDKLNSRVSRNFEHFDEWNKINKSRTNSIIDNFYEYHPNHKPNK